MCTMVSGPTSYGSPVQSTITWPLSTVLNTFRGIDVGLFGDLQLGHVAAEAGFLGVVVHPHDAIART
jgi:hypothetical protein